MESSSFTGEKQLLPLLAVSHFPCAGLPSVLWRWYCMKLGSCRSTLSLWMTVSRYINYLRASLQGRREKWLAQFAPRNVSELNTSAAEESDGCDVLQPLALSSSCAADVMRSFLFVAFLTFPNLSQQMMLWQVSCPNCSMRSKSAGTETTPSRSSATPSPPTPWIALAAGDSLTRIALIDPMAPSPESARYKSKCLYFLSSDSRGQYLIAWSHLAGWSNCVFTCCECQQSVCLPYFCSEM